MLIDQTFFGKCKQCKSEGLRNPVNESDKVVYCAKCNPEDVKSLIIQYRNDFEKKLQERQNDIEATKLLLDGNALVTSEIYRKATWTFFSYLLLHFNFILAVFFILQAIFNSEGILAIILFLLAIYPFPTRAKRDVQLKIIRDHSIQDKIDWYQYSIDQFRKIEESVNN